MSVGRADDGPRHGRLRKRLNHVWKLLHEVIRRLQLGGNNDCVPGQKDRAFKVGVPELAVTLPADYGSIRPDQEDALRVSLSGGSAGIIEICG